MAMSIKNPYRSSTRQLTASEFAAIVPLLRISENRIEAARLVLVEGVTWQAIAEKYGWSRQAVGGTVNAVWRMVEKYRESQRTAANAGALLPPGWEQVTLIAPSHLIAQFRRDIAAAAAIQPTITGKEVSVQSPPQPEAEA